MKEELEKETKALFGQVFIFIFLFYIMNMLVMIG